MNWSSIDKHVSWLFPLIISVCAGGSELLSLPKTPAAASQYHLAIAHFSSESFSIEASTQFRSLSQSRHLPPNSETTSPSQLSAVTQSSQHFVAHQLFSPQLTAMGTTGSPCDVLHSLPRYLGKGQPMTFSSHPLLMFILALLQLFPNNFCGRSKI